MKTTLGIVSLLCLALVSLILGGSRTWASGAIVTTTVEGALPVYTNAVAQYSQVCHFEDSTYAVSLDASGRPVVVKISPAGTTQGFVDAPDLTFPEDGHCAFSLGIDKLGYLHVTGGMHQGWPETKSPVARLFHAGVPSQNILYWKSRRPRSVAGGFTFCGVPLAALPPMGWRASTTIPGSGWQDGRFITDAGGELYYYSMVDAFNRAAWGMGDRGVGFYHYDTKAGTWTALGGEADHTAPGSIGPYYTLLFWQFRDDGWQNFQGTFQFDAKNRLHFATACDTDPSRRGNPRQTRLFYAYSDTGGKSWHKASGAAVPGLPLRGDDGQASQIDVVTTSQDGTLVPWTSVAVDARQRPLVGNAHVWYVWDGRAWATSEALARSGADWATHGRAGGADDNVYFLHLDGAGLLWTPDAGQTPAGYECPGYQQFLCLDEYGLRQTGVFYGVGIKREGRETTGQDVLKTTITPAPLPARWGDADVANAAATRHGLSAPFHGFSGFDNGRFVVNDYGYVINDAADDFHFTYTKLAGDGQIVAHVAAQIPAGNGLAMAGVMMRETLDAGSPNVALCLSPTQTAWFCARSAANQGVSNRYSFPSSASWVKIVRAGSVFTSYASADGAAWMKVTAMTLGMAPTIFVGLSCAGYENGGRMHEATFDHVGVTAAPSR